MNTLGGAHWTKKLLGFATLLVCFVVTCRAQQTESQAVPLRVVTPQFFDSVERRDGRVGLLAGVVRRAIDTVVGFPANAPKRSFWDRLLGRPEQFPELPPAYELNKMSERLVSLKTPAGDVAYDAVFVAGFLLNEMIGPRPQQFSQVK